MPPFVNSHSIKRTLIVARKIFQVENNKLVLYWVLNLETNLEINLPKSVMFFKQIFLRYSAEKCIDLFLVHTARHKLTNYSTQNTPTVIIEKLLRCEGNLRV